MSMLHISDTIEHELTLPASPEVVWEKSFATPAALASWFPERVDGEFSQGSQAFFNWGEHRCEVRIVEYVPGSVLAYQWHPGDAYMLGDQPEDELTTVRFTLSAVEGGTLVRMVESGFSKIAESRAAHALGENTKGWAEELAKLPLGYSA